MGFASNSSSHVSSKMPLLYAVALILVFWTMWSLHLGSFQGIAKSVITTAGQSTPIPHNTNTNALPSTFISSQEPPQEPKSSVGNSKEATNKKSSDLETSSQPENSENHPASEEQKPERPLILYAYNESKKNRFNLQFFIKHGLHAAADFVFILNGETDAMQFIPIDRPNVRYIRRSNTCYDMGAYAEVLLKDDFYKKYQKYIMLNASIRGPFVPYWAEACWSDMYLGRVTDEVKLVGMTMNCFPTIHVQSMIMATDRIGLETMLFPPPAAEQAVLDAFAISSNPMKLTWQKPGINTCFANWKAAVTAEVLLSPLIKAAGYKLDVMMMAFHGQEHGEGLNGKYEETCKAEDVLYDKKYYGTNVHPYETLFLKSNRNIDPLGLRRITEWTAGRKYSSYDVCRV